MKKAALLALLFLAAGLARADGVCGDKGRMQDGACLQEDSFTIGPGISLAFLTHWTASDAINSVKIDVLDAGAPVQTLELSDLSAPTLDLSAQDMNFDGYADIVLLANAGATGNANYMLWVYDPAQKLFVPFPPFMDLSSPNADPKAKVIKTHNKGGNAGLIFVDKTFQWNGGTLGKIAEERQDALRMSSYYYNVRRELVDGKPAVTGERIFRVGDDGAEAEQVCVGKPAGSGRPPESCGAIAAVIDFTAAEAESDLEGMMNAYGPAVTWQGAPKETDALRAMHQKWLAGLTEYTLTAGNFRAAYSEDGSQAQVRCDVTGSYKDSAGKAHSFKIGKQFLLNKGAGDKWFIRCEEVAQFLAGAKGKTSDGCQLR